MVKLSFSGECFYKYVPLCTRNFLFATYFRNNLLPPFYSPSRVVKFPLSPAEKVSNSIPEAIYSKYYAGALHPYKSCRQQCYPRYVPFKRGLFWINTAENVHRKLETELTNQKMEMPLRQHPIKRTL